MLRTLALMILFCVQVVAQTTYSSHPNMALSAPFPAFGADTIAVTGAAGTISSIRIGLRVTDPFEQDSDAWLVPPGVTWTAPYTSPPPIGVIELTTDNGGPNSGYGTGTGASTVFTFFSSADDRTWPATAGRIDDGVPPFTAGVYLPEDTPNFHKLYGISPNGNWTMVVSDDHGFTGNTFNGWEITFHTNFDIKTRAALPVAPAGAAYSMVIEAINGTPGYNWNHTGSLPAGLSLAAVNGHYELAGTPQAAAIGTHTFTVTCTDQTSAQVSKTFALRVTPAALVAPFLDTFSADAGWTLGATWSRGAAVAFTGASSNEPGFDATPQSTDNMILGDNIGGNYGTPIPQTLFATSPVIDCSLLASVQLRYWRCLGVRRRDHNFQAKACMDVSNDGVTWTNVFANNDADMADNGWVIERYDITRWAAGKSTVQVRFGIGDNNDALTLHSGWCIDDFEIRAIPDVATLTMTDFEILAPDTVGSAPNCRVGHTYYFRATLANTGASDVAVDSAAAYMTTFGNPGTLEPVGDIELATPFVVPGSAAAHLVYGLFHCTAIAAVGSGATMRATLTLGGTVQGPGTRVEATGIEIFASSNTAPVAAAMQVREGSSVGTLLLPEAAPPSLVFTAADIAVGPSAGVTVAITNHGGTGLTLGIPQLAGAATEFILDTAGMLAVVPASGSTSFVVKFDPTNVGAHVATIEIPHSDTVVPTPFIIHISGTGVNNAPILEVRDSGPTGAVVLHDDPAAGVRAFGSRETGDGPSAPVTIYVENKGVNPLTLGAPTIASGNTTEFLIDTTGMASTLAMGAATTFTIAYDPSFTSIHSAYIEFTHNDGFTISPFRFEIGGTGTHAVPVLEVREGGPAGPLVANGDLAIAGRDFGGRDIGSGPTAPLTIRVANTGQADMAVGMPLLSGTNINCFSISAPGLPGVVPAGTSLSVSITFDPIAAGKKAATITFTHNDGSVTNPFKFDLAGFGQDVAGVQIATATLPYAVYSTPFATGLTATAGTPPYIWGVHDGILPPGLSLSAAGLIFGTPTAPGTYSFTVRVTDNEHGTADKQFDFDVLAQAGAAPGQRRTGSSSGCSAGAAGNVVPGVAVAFLLIWRGLRRRRADPT